MSRSPKDGDVWVAEAGRGGDRRRRSSCFDSAEGPACTGAYRRDHADQPPGPEARRDRAWRRSRPRTATARSARTACSPTATTSTSPTAARPGRPAALRPSRAARPDARVRGAGLAPLRHAAQGPRARPPRARSPTCGRSRTTTTRTREVGNRPRRLQPGRRARRPRALRRRRRGRQQPAARRPLRPARRAGDLPEQRRRRTRSRPADRSRCRRSRPAWSRARTARST